MSHLAVLDRIAESAPSPSDRLAEDVIGRARQRRHRRWAVLSSSAAVIVVAAVTVVAASTTSSPTGRPVGTSSTHHGSSGPTPASTPGTTLGLVYAAAIRHEVTAVRGSGSGIASIEIIDRYCATAATNGSASCTTARVGPAARYGIAAALASTFGVRVRFVSYDGRRRSSSPNTLVITLAGASVHGTRASAGVEVQCGFDCVGGALLRLALRAGQWVVVGGTSAWTS